MREVPIMNKPPTPTPPPPLRPDTWRTPVPYLVGGLAAMLGLIACALLILACSYWRLSRFLQGENQGTSTTTDGTGSQAAEMNKGEGNVKSPPYFCEGYVVIMPGERKATYLATPAASSTVDGSSDGGGEGTVEGGKGESQSTVTVPDGD